MKTKIETLNQSHICQIYEIEAKAHLTPWSEKIIADSFGPRALIKGLLTESEQPFRILGYYFASEVAGEVSLENICVENRYQGQGFAKVLMQDLIETCQVKNCFEIILEVRASNESAIGLYQKFGFEVVAVRQDYYSIPGGNEKEDALVMKKPLSSL